MLRRLSRGSGVCTSPISLIPYTRSRSAGNFTVAMCCSSLLMAGFPYVHINRLALDQVTLRTLFLDIFQMPSHTNALWYRYCFHII